MKRALSLVLAAALVLGSVPAGFAATPTAGETLKGYNLVAGDTNGNLNEDKTITRGEMMVVLAKLLGKFEEAKAYSIPSTSKDVAGHWAANYIAYAEKEGWTAGKGNGMFDPQGTVTLQEVSVFMLKALGYTADWNTAVKAATDLGLLKEVVAKDAAAKVLRADVFTSALNTINTPVKDTTVKLGVKLGVLKADPVAAVAASSAKALSYKVVEVALTAEVKEVKAADFAVTDAEGKAVEVKAATLIDSKTVWLDTADQAAGKVYTVKVADKTVNFTGLAKDATAPALSTGSSSVKDNVTVELKFDKVLDQRTALVAANYTVDNSLQVTKAEFGKNADGDVDKKVVVLTTSSQKEGTLYTLTVGTKVTDLAGNAVKSADDVNQFKFGGKKADADKPELTSALGANAVKVTLTFTEASGLDKATAENVANYTITNKTDAAKTVTVTKATLVKNTVDNVYRDVELVVTSTVVGNVYEVKAANVADKFGNVISATAKNTTTFSGQPADTTGPSVKSAETKTNTSVKVVFSEKLDKATAETVANYTVTEGLTVVKAVLDADSKDFVTLTTSSQKAGTAYKVTVANVTDEYANKVGSSNSTYFSGIAVDDAKPRVLSAVASVDGSATYVTVKFNKDLNEAKAKVASSYFFGDAVGYGVDVTTVNAYTYKVRVNALDESKSYVVTVSNVEDLSGNLIDSDYTKANFVGKATADNEEPQVVGAVALDASTVKVIFNKAIKATKVENALGVTGTGGASAFDNDASNPENYQIVLESAKTANLLADYSKVYAYVAKDQKSVTLRFEDYKLESGKVYRVYVNGADNVSGAVAFDGTTDSLVSDANNTKKIPASKSFATFGGIGTEAAKPEVVAVYAMNNETVDIKFNMPITVSGLTNGVGKIKFTDSIGITAANSGVLASDNTVLRVKSDAELVSGTVYTMTIVDNTVVKDIYKNIPVNTDKKTGKFTAPTTTNAAPKIASVESTSGSMLTVTFTEDVTIETVSKFVAGAEVAKHVQYKGDSKSVVEVYFNGSQLTSGSVYTFKVEAGGVKDTVGKPNEETTKEFAAIGGDLTLVKIKDVVSLGEKKVRIIFNRPVKNTAAGPVDAVLAKGNIQYKIGSGTAVDVTSLDAAYLAGSKVDLVSNEVPAGKYVDSIDVTVASTLTSGSTYTFSLHTSAILVAMDGAGEDGTVTKTFSGTVALPAAVTAGAAFADSGTASDGIGTVTVTHASLAPDAVKTGFATLAIASATSLDSESAKLAALAAVTTTTPKGADPSTAIATGNIGTGTAKDIIVFYFNASGDVVGYSFFNDQNIQ